MFRARRKLLIAHGPRPYESTYDLALLIVAGSRLLTQGPAPTTRGNSDASEAKVVAKKYEFNRNSIAVEQGEPLRAGYHSHHRRVHRG